MYHTERIRDNSSQAIENDRYLLKREASLKRFLSFKASMDLLTDRKRIPRKMQASLHSESEQNHKLQKGN